MSWDAWLDDGRGAFPFGRPIRWLVFLLDGAVVPFAIHAAEAGAKGGRRRGERPARPAATASCRKARAGRPVEVRSFAELERALRRAVRDPGPEERAPRIDGQLRAAARRHVSTTTACARSGATSSSTRRSWSGEVPAEFRSLPPEVLETVLVHHQKSISLRDEARRDRPLRGHDQRRRRGRRRRSCGAWSGWWWRGCATPRSSWPRTASARSTDRVEDLAGVTFHQGLGTYRDKSARMAKLVEAMGRQGLLSGAALAAATQAARLAKADLVTLMVREFPELQGVMGGIYLAGEGAPDEVSTAVRWHYHPIAVEPEAEPAAAFAGADGKARVFAAVALADKLDTLAGYFGLGESPTGSRDPYGLRRAGQGQCAPSSTSGGRRRARRPPTWRRSWRPRSRATGP